jgi:hypothetical protein
MKLGLNAVIGRERILHFADWIGTVHPRTTVTFGSLRLVRLMGSPNGPEAELLDEALRTGRTFVSEVGGDGVVGLVRVTHSGELPLLLLDGEQIVGARHNRIFNASFLVQPGQCVDLPVSCVERGRWRGKRYFSGSPTTISAAVRAAKLSRLRSSLERGRGHDCDQRAVWRDVDQYLARVGVHSESAAFDDAFWHQHRSAEAALSTLEPDAGQVGIAAVSDDALVTLDLFGSESLHARGWKKVAHGLLVEVYRGGSAPSESQAIQIVANALRAVASSRPTRTASPGGGDTLHMTMGALSFAAITDDDVLYHAVCASQGAASS